MRERTWCERGGFLRERDGLMWKEKEEKEKKNKK